jgi:hypothetical protein
MREGVVRVACINDDISLAIVILNGGEAAVRNLTTAGTANAVAGNAKLK